MKYSNKDTPFTRSSQEFTVVGQIHARRGCQKFYPAPTMMLLMGMKMSFTKKPMKPIIAKPTDVACAIFENSADHESNGHELGSACPTKKNVGAK